MEVIVCNDKIETRVFRKKTNTNVILNWMAMAPDTWKKGLIMCLLHRAKLICSSIKYFDCEVNTLKAIFSSNAYPTAMFNTVYKRFLTGDGVRNVSADDDVLDLIEEQTRKIVLKIPYYGKNSILFAKRFSCLIKSKFNAVDLRTVYCTFKVGTYFQLKCRTPLPLQSNVVYQFHCLRDAGTSYIGETKRHLIDRVKEHTAFKSITRKSEIKSHILNCQNCKNANINYEHFRILRKCKDPSDTRIHEALMIKKVKPNLNKQLYANGASYLLKVF